MDKKALIAMVICGVIMLLYYPFILPLLSKKSKPPQEVMEEPVSEKAREAKVAVKPKPSTVMPAEPVQPQTKIPRKEIIIENELVKMVWTNEGQHLSLYNLSVLRIQRQKKPLSC